MTLSMGTDGHIAGILPNSPALLSTELAVYYKDIFNLLDANTPRGYN